MNPMQQLLLNTIMKSPRVVNNPMAQNLIEMAKQGNVSEIEQFGRNVARERGVDFDKAFLDFKSQFSK